MLTGPRVLICLSEEKQQSSIPSGGKVSYTVGYLGLYGLEGWCGHLTPIDSTDSLSQYILRLK